MAENKLLRYWIIAVAFTDNITKEQKHHRYISHVFMHVESTESYHYPGKLYTKDEVIKIIQKDKTPVFTRIWDYQNCLWEEGAQVDIEEVDKVTYLRTVKDKETTDNLKNMLEYKFFKPR